MPYDNSDEAHSEIYRGFHISIRYDRDPENPRKAWDNAATMVCFHGRYDLGDEDHDYSNPAESIEGICTDENYWLPLYLYDHSGITISTSPFSCPWDSGQVGFIYITKKKAAEEWTRNDGETDEQYKERVEGYLRGEVETYDNYLTGSVYGYVLSTVDPDGEPDEEIEEEGSCWGFFGDYQENALKEAKDIIDGIYDEAA
jgi:hypothetical protein